MNKNCELVEMVEPDRCCGCGGVGRDNAVFVLPSAFGAGAVAWLYCVRGLDGVALCVAHD